MKRRACAILFVALVSITSVSLLGLSAKVYVDRIGGYDAELVNESTNFLTAWIETTGNIPTNNRQKDDYTVEFNVIDVSVRRSFNWWIILFPLWPIVPFTTVNVEVTLSITVSDVTGTEVFSNQAGGEASWWLFGDFTGRRRCKIDAFHQAFKRLVVSARLP